MKSDCGKRRLALFGLILFSALALGIMSTRAPAVSLAGSPQASGAANPIAQIGSKTVTAADFNEQEGIVRSNLRYMRGEIAAGNPSSAYLQAFIDVITVHGIENVAFAGMIENQALYQLAVDRGFSPSDAAVNAKVEQDKRLVDQAGAPAALQAAIAAAGAQRYWSVLFSRYRAA